MVSSISVNVDAPPKLCRPISSQTASRRLGVGGRVMAAFSPARSAGWSARRLPAGRRRRRAAGSGRVDVRPGGRRAVPRRPTRPSGRRPSRRAGRRAHTRAKVGPAARGRGRSPLDRRRRWPGRRPASSARACRVVTASSPRASAAARQNASFLAVESSSVRDRSGRASFSASPGKPAPVPTSMTDAPGGMSTAWRTARESRKCFTAMSRGEVRRVRFRRVAFHSTNISANRPNCASCASVSPRPQCAFAPRRRISVTSSCTPNYSRRPLVIPVDFRVIRHEPAARLSKSAAAFRM